MRFTVLTNNIKLGNRTFKKGSIIKSDILSQSQIKAMKTDKWIEEDKQKQSK